MINKEELEHNVTINTKTGVVKCETSYHGDSVCKLQINMAENNTFWTISSWYTEKGYCHNGIGKTCMKACMSDLRELFGEPKKIQYIWNGVNEYVIEFLTEHFDAVCNCPIAVQKTQTDDDWESHMYTLNKDKVLEYFLK